MKTLFLIAAVTFTFTRTGLPAVIEYFDQSAFASNSAPLTIVTFDGFAEGSTLNGTEIPGLTITARRITILNPQDFAPGLAVGGANVNSQPHGISASLSYSSPNTITFDNGNDNFDFTLATPATSAGLWIGNLGESNGGTNPTSVSFFDASNNLLASESLNQFHSGVINPGNTNNRVFYGVTSDVPIARFSVSNAASDADGIVLDDVQFVPEPSTALFVAIGLFGFVTRRIRNERSA